MGEFTWMYNNTRWRKLRAEQLRKQPLCEVCQEQGRITEATICDHVQSHKGDVVKFWSGPFQSLCKTHHDVKTIMEDGGLNTGANTHPEWLPTPACRVVLVTGSPGSGKTTWAKGQAKPGDVVIDLDDCFAEVCGVHGHEADRQYLKPALRLRNKQLSTLASKRKGIAYVIVGAPSADEVAWWLGKLNAEHHRVECDKDTCLARTPGRRQAAVHKWHEQARANTWAKAERHEGCSMDGTPTSPGHHWNREGG